MTKNQEIIMAWVEGYIQAMNDKGDTQTADYKLVDALNAANLVFRNKHGFEIDFISLAMYHGWMVNIPDDVRTMVEFFTQSK